MVQTLPERKLRYLSHWKPELNGGLDYSSLMLDSSAGFALSRIDGRTSVAELKALTGLSADYLQNLLHTLVGQKAIHFEKPMDPDKLSHRSPSPPAYLPSDMENYRELYRQHFQGLGLDVRISRAQKERGAMLSALCLDRNPAIIREIMGNQNVTVKQAQIIARYHTTTIGLSALGKKNSFLFDHQLRRYLTRSQHAPVLLLRRAIEKLSMVQCFSLGLSREVTDKAKRQSRETLRILFSQAPQDERVQLILRTEGRCLKTLNGLTLGGKTIALLCRKSQFSSILIRNLCSFSGLTPMLIRHLFRQTIVRSNFGLKKLLLRHSNCPSELKK